MPHPSKRPLLGVAVVLIAAVVDLSCRPQEAGPAVPVPPPPPPAPVKAELLLIPQEGAERSLVGGGVHSYRIDLPADAFLHAVAEQEGVDLALRLSGPDGQEILEVDSPTGSQGAEDLYFVAPEKGEYRLEVRAYESQAAEGSYRLRVTPLRPAEDHDRRQAESEMAFHRARARRQSDPETARAGFQEAARLFAALGDRKRQGRSLFQLAQLTADPAASGDLVEQAWTLSREAGDSHGELAASNELVRRLEESGLDLDRAEKLGRRAVELARNLGASRSEAVARTNLGKIILSRGDAWEALAQLEPAVALWQSLPDDPDQEAAADISAAHAYAVLGKPRKGLRYLDRALSLLPLKERKLRAAALTKKGDLLSMLGEFDAARMALRQALDLRTPDDLSGRANTHLSLGALDYRQGRLREALEEYQEAAVSFEAGRDPRMRLAVRVNQGWAHALLGEFGRATAFLLAALEDARRSGIRPAEASALFGLAWIERRRGRKDEARRQAEASLEVIESLRNAERRELRASYLSANLDPYDFLIDLWMERHRSNPKARYDLQALAVAERSRGRSLLDEMGQGRGGRPLPIETIQRLALADGSLLLEYHLGDTRSFLWAVDAAGVTPYELPPREEIEKLTHRVLSAMVESRGGDERELHEKGRELSQILLGQVAGRLRDLGERPLRIAADGSLHALSFAALPDPAVPASQPYKPLVVDRLIVHTLSGSVLAAQTRSRPWRSGPCDRMALIGDPVFNPLDERLRALPALADRPSGLINRSGVGYRRLPFAQEEIQHIQSLMPRESVLVRTGFDANRAFILRGGLQGFDLLHIASHGLIDPEDGGRAALVLSLYDRKGNRIDGFLRARDIDTLDLSFRLVVLSACETGLGEELRGEGQVGLAQSFLAAGADDVVASLWSVPDDRTFELMSGFYKRLFREGLSPAQALRQAQIKAWRDPDYRAPYYWAGFTIQGRGAPAAPGMKRGAPPPEPVR